MKTFLIRLKIILNYKWFIYLLLIILLIKPLLIIKDVNKPIKVPNDSKISGVVLDYKINGNKLTIKTKQTTIIYYFKDNKEITRFKIGYGDTFHSSGAYQTYQSNSIPFNFNNKLYQQLNGHEYYFEAKAINLTPTNNYLYKVKNYYFNHLKSYDNYDYYLALMMGNKNYLDSDFETIYSDNGISHLLAMSGLHLGLFIIGINYFLKLIHISKSKRIIVFIIFIIILLFMTNYNLSLLRASLFFLYLNLNKRFKVVNSNNKVLLYVLITCLLFNSRIIFNLGFVYSFLCTWALVNYHFSKQRILGLFEVSLVTFLVTLPITIKLNHSINLLSFLFNLVLVPYMSYLLLPLIIFSSFIPFINPLASLFIRLFNYLNCIFYNISLFKVIIPDYPNYLFIIYYIIFIAFLKHKKFIIGLLLILLIIKILPFFNNDYLITFLDVGQGDSILMVTPHLKQVIMIDTGGKVKYDNDFVYYKKYLDISKSINYLKGLGITKINYLIITHGDYDHMGEAINLVENFKVENVIFNCGEYNKLEKDLITVLDKKKISYSSCVDKIEDLIFLQTKDYDNENDNSNVIYTEIDGYKLMFMGDAGVETEMEILKKYNLSNIDVLKVGHHGSRTSSGEEFINEINPKYSIISVGKNNRYGHPNKEVLDNLKDSKILRTDQDGSIIFNIRSNRLKREL